MPFKYVLGLVFAAILAMTYVLILGKMGKRLGRISLFAGLPASVVALNLSGMLLENIIHDKLFLFVSAYATGFGVLCAFHRFDETLQRKKLNPQPLYFNAPKAEVYGALLDVLKTSGFPGPQKSDQERGLIYNTREWTEQNPNGKSRALSLTCTAIILQEGELTKVQLNWSTGVHFIEVSNPTVFRIIDSVTEHFVESVKSGGISNIGL